MIDMILFYWYLFFINWNVSWIFNNFIKFVLFNFVIKVWIVRVNVRMVIGEIIVIRDVCVIIEGYVIRRLEFVFVGLDIKEVIV